MLLPLAAIVVQSGAGGWAGFLAAITSTAAVESYRVTLTVAVGVTVVNTVFGLLLAWVLVRDDFPGKRLVDTVIDLPFALPDHCGQPGDAGAVRAGKSGEPASAAHPVGVGVALLFVTLPFVVRSVQPVLLELDRDVEEAAASLGATNAVIFGRVVLPALVPALLSGAGLAFSRAIGEFGSVVLIGGRCPARPRCHRSGSAPDRERRPHRCGRGFSCAAGRFVPGAAGPAAARIADRPA